MCLAHMLTNISLNYVFDKLVGYYFRQFMYKTTSLANMNFQHHIFRVCYVCLLCMFVMYRTQIFNGFDEYDI